MLLDEATHVGTSHKYYLGNKSNFGSDIIIM